MPPIHRIEPNDLTFQFFTLTILHEKLRQILSDRLSSSLFKVPVKIHQYQRHSNKAHRKAEHVWLRRFAIHCILKPHHHHIPYNQHRQYHHHHRNGCIHFPDRTSFFGKQRHGEHQCQKDDRPIFNRFHCNCRLRYTNLQTGSLGLERIGGHHHEQCTRESFSYQSPIDGKLKKM